MGEVGLGGEVRSIARVEQRLKEALNMGFQRCVLPKRNLKGLSFQGIELTGGIGWRKPFDKLLG
jgi:DNA repair protein RadA/Sms